MRVKGHCPTCGPNRWADVAADFRDQWEEELNSNYSISGDDTHRILKCGGCGRVYFQSSAIFSEDDPTDGPTITHWPSPVLRENPRWMQQLISVDHALYNLVVETYSAVNHEAWILAAIGLRTIFDRCAEKLGADPASSFEEKLGSLVLAGKIGADEQRVLAILTDAGSAAAHRGWRPTQEQIETMLDIVETFLHRSFFLSQAAKELAATVPPKLKRGNKPSHKS